LVSQHHRRVVLFAVVRTSVEITAAMDLFRAQRATFHDLFDRILTVVRFTGRALTRGISYYYFVELGYRICRER
jgi:hypothetical protein